jgi:HlyD family secretion protein
MEAQGNVGITQLRGDYAIQQAQSQWLSAYDRYAQAKRNLELLQRGPTEEQIQQLELQIEQARINLEQAEDNLDATVLTAPFSGVIARVNIQESTPAPTAIPAFTLMDNAVYYVDLSVDEIDIGALQEGQPVTVTLDAFPAQPLPGTVDRIGKLPELSGGVIVYPVRIQLTATEDVDVRDGMTASATIITGQRRDILLVPNWAIRTDQSSAQTYTYCYCIENGEPRRVPVELGVRNDEWTEITGGLEEGATVALVTEGRNILEFQGPPSDGRP